METLIPAMKTLLGTECALIPFYTSKASFGDADILVNSDNLPDNWVDVVVSNFDLTEDQWVKNSNVLSIAVRELQVDLICTPGKYFKSSLDYFSYNDLHNLTGRLSHKLGIKHGHKGLSLIVRHKSRSDHILEEIELETDEAKDAIYEILGLDPNFVPADPEAIFAFVASSKFFDPDVFLLENRNSVSRVRDKKRAIYRGMLEWCESHPESKKFSFPEKDERGGYSIREPFYSDIVLKRWSWVEQRVNTVIAQFELDQEFAEVYNGKVVSARTGYSGKRLGAFMKVMKERIKDNNTKRLWIASENILNLNIDEQWMLCGGVQFMKDLAE